MRRVLLLAFEGVQTLDVTGPAEVFAAAGRVRGEELYRVELLSPHGGLVRSTAGLGLETRSLAGVRLRSEDTVLVAGGEERALREAIAEEKLRDFLVHAARVAGRWGSVCSGAFVLAAYGLLDGRRAATHWMVCDRLASFRPAVQVDRDAAFVRDGSLWTSAGVCTGIDLCLAMVEQDHDRALADAVASRLVLYARRQGSQAQFTDALVAQREASDPLGPALEWARGNVRSATVRGLARRAGLSERTLHRRCKELLRTTPARLLERLRVDFARTLVTRGASQKTLAARAGFGNPERMRRAFGRVLGLTPRQYALLFAG